uniref:Alpha/beta hydrolase fold-3 domain-containing protein n=1 Tax=Oryza meridionalis TaxID=40149 RepID=A0A0E0ECB3_9ORYZ
MALLHATLTNFLETILLTNNCPRARLFLPSGAAATGQRRLPIVVYFHGGSFCTESAFCRTYHRYATFLASRAGALVVSVEYRLAPEHPIPAAYDDAWAALQWVASLSDPWFADYGDLRPRRQHPRADHGAALLLGSREAAVRDGLGRRGPSRRSAQTSRTLMESIVRFINRNAARRAASPWPASVLPELHEHFYSPLHASNGDQKMSRGCN